MKAQTIKGQQAGVTGSTALAAAISVLPGVTVRSSVTEEVVAGGHTGRVSVVHDLVGVAVQGLLRAAVGGELRQHPVSRGLLAIGNHVALKRAVGPMRLELVQAEGLYRLVAGADDPLHAHSARIQTRDAAVAAGLITCGFPLLDVTSGGYLLSALGKPISDYATGVLCSPEPSRLISRGAAMNEVGVRVLLLQEQEPEHPMAQAVAAVWRYLYLRQRVERGPRAIHVRPRAGAALSALVASNATGRVLDRVQQHFRLPVC